MITLKMFESAATNIERLMDWHREVDAFVSGGILTFGFRFLLLKAILAEKFGYGVIYYLVIFIVFEWRIK